MTEKRFVYYEHKGADYILDTPNESLDFIEMLGDCLEAEEIVDLLNYLNDENEQLKQFKEEAFTLINEELARSEKRIELGKETLDLLNEFHEINKELKEENEQLKKENEFLKKRCNEYWGEAGLNNDYFE